MTLDERSVNRQWAGLTTRDWAVNTGTLDIRLVHPEESRVYDFRVTAGSVPLRAILPYDVRGWPLGDYLVIINTAGWPPTISASTKDVQIEDANGQVLETLAPGFVAKLWLTDNANAAGEWLVYVSAEGGAGRVVEFL